VAEGLFARVEPAAIGSLSVMIGLIGLLGYGGWTVLQEIQRVEFAPVEQTPGIVAELDGFAAAGAGGPGSYRTGWPDCLP